MLAALVPVAVLARIAVADPWSGLVVALTLPLAPVFGALIGMATARYSRERWQALGALAHHFHDVVAGLAALKVFRRARHPFFPPGATPRTPRSTPAAL